MAEASYVLSAEEVSALTDLYASLMAFRLGIDKASRDARCRSDLADGIAERLTEVLEKAEEVIFDAIEEGDADILLSWVEQSGDFEGDWKMAIQRAVWDDITG